MKKYIIRKIPLVIAAVALGVFLFSALFMLLWNSILPAVIHVSAITIWQAAGILLISKILFGGFRGRNRMHRWSHKGKMHWHNRDTQDEQRHYSCYYRTAEGS